MSDDDRTAIRLQAARASVRRSLQNIYFLGIKEFFSLLRDWAMMGVIVFMFTGAVLADARAKPDTLSNAAIAVVANAAAGRGPDRPWALMGEREKGGSFVT